MTEEEYIELEDGVEFYLQDNRGNYFVMNEHNGLQKVSEAPNFVWKIQKDVQSHRYALQMNNEVYFYFHRYFIDANQQLCAKWLHEDDELCYGYGFTRCGKYRFVFDSFSWKKESFEPVFVEFIAPHVLK